MAFLLSLLAAACLLFVAAMLADGFVTVTRRHYAAVGERSLQLVVTSRSNPTGRLMQVSLAHPRGRTLPGFVAGQHLSIEVPAGTRGQRTRRTYSLAGWDEYPSQYQLGIKREIDGLVSSWLWQHLSPGTLISASVPSGAFVLDESDDLLILIAGGIGITPLRAMVHQALFRRRTLVLFQAVRHENELLYRGEFTQLSREQDGIRYIPVVSRPIGQWDGETGRLNGDRIIAMLSQARQARYYLCAANEMMANLRDGLISAGIPPSRIHWEAFGAGSRPGASGLAVQVSHRGLLHSLRTSGEPTLLATLEAHDLAPPAECRAGTCGSCAIRLQAGRVNWLLQPEYSCGENEILPCVCVPETDVKVAR